MDTNAGPPGGAGAVRLRPVSVGFQPLGWLSNQLDRLFVPLSLLPTFLLVGLTFLIPLIASAILSFKGYAPQGDHFAAPFVGLDNYSMLATDDRFLKSLELTCIFTFSAVVLELLLGLGVALLLNIALPGLRIFRALIIVPMMMTPIVGALAWKLLLDPSYGVVNRLLGLDIVWLGQPVPAFIAVLMVNIWQNIPFVAIILMSALKTFPTEPYEAARIDGATRMQIFQHLTLPMLRPFLLVVTLLRTIFEFRAFENAYILTGGGPADSTLLLSVYTYDTSFLSFDLSLGSAAAWITLLISVLLCVGFVWALRRNRVQ
jgi:multiple sugar transport system permease protein